MRWLIHESNGNGKTFALYEKYARDILKDPYFMWIEKIVYASPIFFSLHAIVYLIVASVISVWLYGYTMEALQLSASVFLWA